MYPDSPNPASPADQPETVANPAPVRSASEALIEQFAKDYLKDRRSTRRWNLLIRLGWLIAFSVLVWGFVNQGSPASAPSGPHTALVELRGEIAADTEASAEVMLSGLKTAFEDVGARAVVIRINSPGGSPVQAGIIHDELLRLKALHGKQLYVANRGSAHVYGPPEGKGSVSVIDFATRQVQVLTDSAKDESPSFAPNGRLLLYATEINGSGILLKEHIYLNDLPVAVIAGDFIICKTSACRKYFL